MNRGVGGKVVDESHVGGFFEGIFVVLDNSEQRIYSIVCLCVGLCPWLVVCKRVEKFRVCCQSRNKKAFEEFCEGVIQIYTSVGCGVCFVLCMGCSRESCQSEGWV